jgi:hypothetical protein
MRRAFPTLAAAALSACLVESQPTRTREVNRGPDRSAETVNEIDRQQRWLAEAVAGRPSTDELQAVREGDADAVSDTRKRFRRLLTAVERATWIRETVAEVLRAASEPERLVSAFAAAGRDRNEAFAAADDTASALAESRVRNAISLDELKRALQVARKAEESEKKLAADLGRAARTTPDGGPDPLQRLATVPMPARPQFIDAAARYLAAHPGEDRALDSWPPLLAQERTRIRAAAADLHLPQPEAADAGMASLDRDVEDGGDPSAAGKDAGSETAEPAVSTGAPDGGIQVAGDLKRLLARRGPPLSIAQRPDGLTAFRYSEQRPCGVDSCTVTVDYLFDSRGHLVRDEVVKP